MLGRNKVMTDAEVMTDAAMKKRAGKNPLEKKPAGKKPPEKKQTGEKQPGKKQNRNDGKNHNSGLLANLSVFLTDQLKPYNQRDRHRSLHEDVRILSGGRKNALREFYLYKTRMILSALLAGLVLIAAAFVMSLLRSHTIPDGMIQRPGYGEADREYTLGVKVDGREDVIDLQVQSRQYTPEQADHLLKKAKDQLESCYLGTNPSPDEVRSSLYLPSALCQGAVKVSWTLSSYDLVDDTGSLLREPDPAGEVITLKADLVCQDQKLFWEQGVKVLPQPRTDEEEARRTLLRAAEDAESMTPAEPYMQLPSHVNGKEVLWNLKEPAAGNILILIGMILPVLLYFHCDQKVHEEARRREQQLRLDYPELMWKMTMLLGAGLTLSGAFARIADDYQKRKGKEKRYVYEEMLYTCREIGSGRSEGTAYEQFGRRCGLQRYVQLGTILSQNLKKGSGGLAALLEKEAVSTMTERRDEARKLGEKAGTKLLLPMMIMLCTVMMILTVPAFLSM